MSDKYTVGQLVEIRAAAKAAWQEFQNCHKPQDGEYFAKHVVARLTEPAIHPDVVVELDWENGHCAFMRASGVYKQPPGYRRRILIPEELVKEMVKPIILDVWHGRLAWDLALAELSAKIAHYTTHGEGGE